MHHATPVSTSHDINTNTTLLPAPIPHDIIINYHVNYVVLVSVKPVYLSLYAAH